MNEPTVLLLCSDLYFSTQLRGAAEQAGWQPVVELSAASALERVARRQSGIQAVVVDLELSGLDIDAFMSQAPSGTQPEVIAFGPHVQERRLQAARDAGCDRVLSRGQIAASLRQILMDMSDTV